MVCSKSSLAWTILVRDYPEGDSRQLCTDSTTSANRFWVNECSKDLHCGGTVLTRVLYGNEFPKISEALGGGSVILGRFEILNIRWVWRNKGGYLMTDEQHM